MTETQTREVDFEVEITEQPQEDRVWRWKWTITEKAHPWDNTIASGHASWRITAVVAARMACRRHARARLSPNGKRSFRFHYTATWEDRP